MDTRTHYEFERDECSGWAKWLGTVAVMRSAGYEDARIVKLVEEHNNG